jgi:hypothetical protein
MRFISDLSEEMRARREAVLKSTAKWIKAKLNKGLTIRESDIIQKIETMTQNAFTADELRVEKSEFDPLYGYDMYTDLLEVYFKNKVQGDDRCYTIGTVHYFGDESEKFDNKKAFIGYHLNRDYVANKNGNIVEQKEGYYYELRILKGKLSKFKKRFREAIERELLEGLAITLSNVEQIKKELFEKILLGEDGEFSPLIRKAVDEAINGMPIRSVYFDDGAYTVYLGWEDARYAPEFDDQEGKTLMYVQEIPPRILEEGEEYVEGYYSYSSPYDGWGLTIEHPSFSYARSIRKSDERKKNRKNHTRKPKTRLKKPFSIQEVKELINARRERANQGNV